MRVIASGRSPSAPQTVHVAFAGQAAGSPPAGRLVLTFALCLLANVFGGMVSTLMAAYLPDAVQDLLGTSDAATVSHIGSYVGGLFLVGWAIGGVGLGWAGDRIGRVQAFSAAVLLYAGATALASTTQSWPALVACRLLTGVGVGGTLVVSAILVAEAANAGRRAIFLGILAVAYPIGIISAGAVNYAVPSWRAAFLIAVVPLALGLIGLAVLRNSRDWLSVREERRTSQAVSAFATLAEPHHRVNLILGAGIFGAMLIGLWATFSWLPTWAQDLVGTDPGGQQKRGILMMLLGSGGILGGSFSGLLANRWGRRRAMLLAFGGCFFASAILFGTNTGFSPVIYFQTAFLALFFGISQGILTAYIPELFPTRARSTGTGLCFNIGRLATALAVFFVGVLVPLLGGYGSAVLVFSLTYVIGFTLTWFGPETRVEPRAVAAEPVPAVEPA